jgi:hypothetical protein
MQVSGLAQYDLCSDDLLISLTTPSCLLAALTFFSNVDDVIVNEENVITIVTHENHEHDDNDSRQKKVTFDTHIVDWRHTVQYWY